MTQTIAKIYGNVETNPLPADYKLDPITTTVDWTEPGLRVTRLRLLSDPGHPYWDVSYCVGVLPTGEVVWVNVPFSAPCTLRKYGTSIKTQIIGWAKREGVYAKQLGILDVISTFN